MIEQSKSLISESATKLIQILYSYLLLDTVLAASMYSITMGQ
jgi:hypothetical protein